MNEVARRARAIIVVDPQPDFFEGGPLPIEGATRACEKIAAHLRDRGDRYSMTIVTQDWHVDPVGHWSKDPDYITSWPVHCVADSRGAEIHSSLIDQDWDVVIRKGQYDAAYSGFEGTNDVGRSLANALSSAEVDAVTVVGFATDYCVLATALDARALGLEVDVVLDLCAGVADETTREAVAVMAEAGVTINESAEP